MTWTLAAQAPSFREGRVSTQLIWHSKQGGTRPAGGLQARQTRSHSYPDSLRLHPINRVEWIETNCVVTTDLKPNRSPPDK